MDLLEEERECAHVELEEFLVSDNTTEKHECIQLFQSIIGDIQEAGWSRKMPRENEAISDQDLRYVFDKVDLDRDNKLNRLVGTFSIIHNKNMGPNKLLQMNGWVFFPALLRP